MKTHVIPFAAALAAAALAAAAPLAAQAPTLELPAGQRVVLLDASGRLPQAKELPEPATVPRLGSPGGPELEQPRELRPGGPLAAAAAFLRYFAPTERKPPFDVQVLADRWLAVLGNEQQTADVAAMLQRALATPEDLLRIEFELLRVPDATYQKVLADLFLKDTPPDSLHTCILSGPIDGLWTRLGDGCERVTTPTLVTRSLRPVTVTSGSHTSYVRDYRVVTKGDTKLAQPIVDQVFDGIEIWAIAAPYRDGFVALDCSVATSKREDPIAESKVDIGLNVPFVIQLPRVTSLTLDQRGVMPLGASLLLAKRRDAGDWHCVLVRVSREP